METQEQVTEPIVEVDPFALDETALISLSPEQRAGLDPIIDNWKKRANEEIGKRESSVSEKYRPLEEKASALDKLTAYAPFQNWWNEQQKQGQQNNPQAAGAIAQTKPQDVATAQEWQEAIWEASQGNPQKISELQTRMTSAWAAPYIQQVSQENKNIRLEMELKDLFEQNPDAKELDMIGLDPKTKQGVSLLEIGFDWAERNRQPMIKGYEMAKKWSDSMKVGAQQQAMGMVQDKKKDITAGPSTSIGGTNIVEVANQDEMMTKSMNAQMAGDTKTRFVIRGQR